MDPSADVHIRRAVMPATNATAVTALGMRGSMRTCAPTASCHTATLPSAIPSASSVASDVVPEHVMPNGIFQLLKGHWRTRGRRRLRLGGGGSCSRRRRCLHLGSGGVCHFLGFCVVVGASEVADREPPAAVPPHVHTVGALVEAVRLAGAVWPLLQLPLDVACANVSVPHQQPMHRRHRHVELQFERAHLRWRRHCGGHVVGAGGLGAVAVALGRSRRRQHGRRERLHCRRKVEAGRQLRSINTYGAARVAHRDMAGIWRQRDRHRAAVAAALAAALVPATVAALRRVMVGVGRQRHLCQQVELRRLHDHLVQGEVASRRRRDDLGARGGRVAGVHSSDGAIVRAVCAARLQIARGERNHVATRGAYHNQASCARGRRAHNVGRRQGMRCGGDYGGAAGVPAKSQCNKKLEQEGDSVAATVTLMVTAHMSHAWPKCLRGGQGTEAECSNNVTADGCTCARGCVRICCGLMHAGLGASALAHQCQASQSMLPRRR
eukprot:363540-Chlamydomonas_euryale.AAC.9